MKYINKETVAEYVRAYINMYDIYGDVTAGDALRILMGTCVILFVILCFFLFMYIEPVFRFVVFVGGGSWYGVYKLSKWAKENK